MDQQVVGVHRYTLYICFYSSSLSFQSNIVYIIMESQSVSFFLDFIYLFYTGGQEGEREGEKHQCVVASCANPPGELTHTPGICPDWELNRVPFGSQACFQSTELYQPGPISVIFKVLTILRSNLLKYKFFLEQRRVRDMIIPERF